MVRRLLAPLWLVTALMVIPVRVAAFDAAEDEETVGVGLPAPRFSAKTLNPEAAGMVWFRLDELAGDEPEDPGAKVVLISFFASWCGPCQKELPFLVQLDRMYRDRGLRVVSITIDRDEAGVEAARRQVAAAKAVHPVLWDRSTFIGQRYLGEASKLPSVFLIGRDGNVLTIERGYARDAPAFLLAEVQQALGLKGAPGSSAVQPVSSKRP